MPMIFFVIPRKRELQSGKQAAAGDLQLLHHFTFTDQIHTVVEVHHRADVVGVELHLVAHPDGFPEAGVVDDGVLVVHIEYMDAIIALDESQTGGGADALCAGLGGDALGAHVGDDPLRRGAADDGGVCISPSS